MTDIDVKLFNSELNVANALNEVKRSSVGGIDIFVGTVRDQTKGQRVTKLHFEGYEPMALKEMRKIAEEAAEKWDLKAVLLHHRLGTLQVGEVPVIIAAASAHRKASFEACEFMIDQLKVTVPIWKKEFFENGEVWVAAHP